MKVVLIDRSSQLVVAERPDPQPAEGHTLIQVKAAGVNFADCLARQGLYPDAPARPFVPGYEVAGETESGMRVMAFARFGGYSELVSVPDSQVYPLPPGFSFEEGAGLLVTGLTAVYAMLGYGPLRKGDRVLIHAAAGGVGLCAVQIGLTHEVEIFGTVGSDEKCAVLADMGVAHPINYRRVDWSRSVRDLGGNLDLILDSIGGPYIPKGISLLSPGGILVAFGIANASGGGMLRAAASLIQGAFLPVIPLLSESRGLIGLNLLKLAARPAKLEWASKALQELVAEGKVRPKIGGSFPLAEAAKAHALLEGRASVGKVVLTM